MTTSFSAPVLCLFMWSGSALLAPTAYAQDAFRFDIPSQSLSQALRAVGRQTNTNIIFEPALVDGMKAAELKAEVTAEAAVRMLLDGTQLVFQRASPDTIVIRRESDVSKGEVTSGDPTASLETVNVFASMEDPMSIGSKAGQSLREIPKSVTQVTRERIETQNLQSLTDALTQTTGISVSKMSPLEVYYYSRGFEVQTVVRDGGAAGHTGTFGAYLSENMAGYERVEVLRGVDGIYTGAGEPGGVVNAVRKRARAEPAVQLSLSGGSWDDYRGEIDVTGGLAQDGRLRGRLVGSYNDKNYFYDNASSNNLYFFGTAEYDLTPTTVLIAGASYEDKDEDGFNSNGLPRYSDGGDLRLPRSTNLSARWSHWYATSKEFFVRAEQRYGETGVVKLNYTHTDLSTDYRAMQPRGAVDPVTLTGTVASAWTSIGGSVQDMIDLSSSGKFGLFGRQHSYTVGLDTSKVDGGGSGAAYITTGYHWLDPSRPLDVFNFDPALFPEPTRGAPLWRNPEYGQEQKGAYASVGLQVAEPLRLMLSARYGKYRYFYSQQSYQGLDTSGVQIWSSPPSRTRYDDSKLVPSAALIYDFARDWTVYASYAETFKVQANLLQGPLPGTPLDPVTGAGYEIGVKSRLFGKLDFSAAIYRMERNGQGVRDLSYPSQNGALGSTCCYLGAVDVRSQGLDVEASGTVLPGWQLFGGYTYHTNDVYGDESVVANSSLHWMPKHQLKLWTTWQLPADYSRWTLTAGVVGQSDVYASGTALAEVGGNTYVPFRFVQDAYSVWNASVQYQFNDTWRVGLYADNLFDETYYSALSGTSSHNFYGSPRSYMLTVRAHY
ncbi:TonB-dependent siderophore receptor [Steroidobacter sp.]|uniref:TonB-dependent siderophore receptor n=1 Tax=Steroidobacter sp. TaxID=1978227 RepID=UPI001A3E2E29|nr:TonB-dependent receptor [Steroidobacter sp.]MBL8270610.1 TonB-dependent siderophore receptor [Steroidobacter sp.]